MQPEDLVVIYFSSHGSPRNADPNGVSYIVTYDTDLSGPEKLYATSLQMIDLVQELNREIKARRVVLFLDTCFSGDAQSQPSADDGSKRITPVWEKAPPADAPAAASFSGALANLKIGYGRAVITASRADEQSWESATLHNGYFTHYLLLALKDAQGTRNIHDAFEMVRGEVSESVRRDHHAEQTPTSQFSENAESIVLGIPELP